ncbi:hypothetical protein EV209_3127 [Cuneatibacter caecimuris]|uniref:Uncharacterized protein n=1 Tax=Cuneatibacter caecimuris TaxID=1796618 RepID=A0A4Q7NYB8_9FIRM|nr:hypothetical protein EV209_3127 [Cuneatibacter caecimuris]
MIELTEAADAAFFLLLPPGRLQSLIEEEND